MMTNPRSLDIQVRARYVNGCGKAHVNCSRFWPEFGCEMVGTFNAETSVSLEDFEPCATAKDGTVRLWLVRLLQLSATGPYPLEQSHYGWALRWDGSRQSPQTWEIISKRPFPDDLKSGEIVAEVLEPWGEAERREFIAGRDWFQSFEWHAGKADSAFVWDTIAPHMELSGASVLDYGCNYGAFCFRASKAGAAVTGMDRPPVIATARAINDRIEMQDVRFVDPGYDFDGESFDYLLYLSVHHQLDPTYGDLQPQLRRLASRTRKRLFVELINPPLKGGMANTEVDRIVGGEVLARYRHAVRCNRTIYMLPGEAS